MYLLFDIVCPYCVVYLQVVHVYVQGQYILLYTIMSGVANNRIYKVQSITYVIGSEKWP